MLHPRARTMLLLAPPALIIGVASSLILIVIMKVASVLQSVLWTSLPASLGLNASSPVWVILILTLTGIVVGVVIRYSPGHAGPDPATEPLIGAPVNAAALPGLIIALIIGLAGGVSLGPEHPVMAVNIALAVAIGAPAMVSSVRPALIRRRRSPDHQPVFSSSLLTARCPLQPDADGGYF